MCVPAGPTDWSWHTRKRRPRGKSAVDSDVDAERRLPRSTVLVATATIRKPGGLDNAEDGLVMSALTREGCADLSAQVKADVEVGRFGGRADARRRDSPS